MWKKIAITALALVAISFYLFNPSVDVTNYPSSNTGVIAFGDSLVEGVGSESGGGFVSMLSKDLGVPIVNLGVSGDTTADALERISQVTERKPAVTIVLLGGNDFLQQVPEEETVGNLEKIIETIHRSGSAVVLVGIEAKIYPNNHGDIFESLAKRYGAAYVPDVLDDTLGVPGYTADALHPNDKGYRVVSERIKPILEKLLD